MGVEGVEILSNWQSSGSDGVERESAEEERERKDAEKAAAVKERQIRLGHIPVPEEPKKKSRNKKK